MRPLSPDERESLESATTSYETHLDAVLGYLQGRGISRGIAEDFRLGCVTVPAMGHEAMQGRLAIPTLGPGGSVRALRFRAVDDSEPKYLGLPGVTRLFNVRAVAEAGEAIWITEGELDAVMLEQRGCHAVGVPGANGWKDHHPRLFAGFKRIIVTADGDRAGRDFGQRVKGTLPQAEVLQMPDGEDVGSVLASGAIPEQLAEAIDETASL